jgi:hypothetical protein
MNIINRAALGCFPVFLRDKLLDDFEFFDQLTRVSAVTQNRPLKVEIKGFKTSHSFGVKTALIGLGMR